MLIQALFQKSGTFRCGNFLHLHILVITQEKPSHLKNLLTNLFVFTLYLPLNSYENLFLLILVVVNLIADSYERIEKILYDYFAVNTDRFAYNILLVDC